MHIHILCGRVCVWMLVAGEALFAHGRCVCAGWHDAIFIHRACVVHDYFVVCCLCRRGAWMFAGMLIHFRFGKFLHHPYVLLLGEVMPNFSGEHSCVCMLLRF